MAKKARRKREEDAESTAFEFPEFDLRKFLEHEYEQTYATALSLGLAVLLGFASWGLARAGLPSVVPLVVGLAVIVFSPYLLQRVRTAAQEYTKGDWAGLILTELFGWLGIWFLLLSLARV
jgi:hypothetical protein